MATIVDKRFWMPPAAYFAIGSYVLGIPIGIYLVHFVPGSRDNVDDSSVLATPFIALIVGFVIGHFLGKKSSSWFKPIRPWVYCPIIGILLELLSIYFGMLLIYLANNVPWLDGPARAFVSVFNINGIPCFYGIAFSLCLAAAFVLEVLSKKFGNSDYETKGAAVRPLT